MCTFTVFYCYAEVKYNYLFISCKVEYMRVFLVLLFFTKLKFTKYRNLFPYFFFFFSYKKISFQKKR